MSFMKLFPPLRLYSVFILVSISFSLWQDHTRIGFQRSLQVTPDLVRRIGLEAELEVRDVWI